MVKSSEKAKKYIPNPFEAQALKELKQPWRFYSSKEDFEKKVAEYKEQKIQTAAGEVDGWQAAKANALISFGAELSDYKEETLAAAESQIRNDKKLWKKIQAAHLYNTLGVKPEINLADSQDLGAADIMQKIGEYMDKMEKGSLVDGKYVPSKAEKNLLRTFGDYGEFIRNPKSANETSGFAEELKKRLERISKRDNFLEPQKKKEKQPKKDQRKDNTMSDENSNSVNDILTEGLNLKTNDESKSLKAKLNPKNPDELIIEGFDNGQHSFTFSYNKKNKQYVYQGDNPPKTYSNNPNLKFEKMPDDLDAEMQQTVNRVIDRAKVRDTLAQGVEASLETKQANLPPEMQGELELEGKLNKKNKDELIIEGSKNGSHAFTFAYNQQNGEYTYQGGKPEKIYSNAANSKFEELSPEMLEELMAAKEKLLLAAKQKALGQDDKTISAEDNTAGKDDEQNKSEEKQDDKVKPLNVNVGTPKTEENTDEKEPDWVKKKAEYYAKLAEEGKIQGYEQLEPENKQVFAAKLENAEIHYSSPDNVTVSQDAGYKVFDTMLKEPDNKGRPIEFPDNASKEVATRLYAACVLNGNKMQGAVPTEIDMDELAKCGLSAEQIKQVQDYYEASKNKDKTNANTGTEKQEEKHAEEPQLSDKTKADIQKISEIKKNFEQMKQDGKIAIQKDKDGKPQIVAGEKGTEEDVKNANAIMKEAAELVKAGLSENRSKNSNNLETQQQQDTNTAFREQQRDQVESLMTKEQLDAHRAKVEERAKFHAAKLGMLPDGVEVKDKNGKKIEALKGDELKNYQSKLQPNTLAAIKQKFDKANG